MSAGWLKYSVYTSLICFFKCAVTLTTTLLKWFPSVLLSAVTQNVGNAATGDRNGQSNHSHSVNFDVSVTSLIATEGQNSKIVSCCRLCMYSSVETACLVKQVFVISTWHIGTPSVDELFAAYHKILNGKWGKICKWVQFSSFTQHIIMYYLKKTTTQHYIGYCQHLVDYYTCVNTLTPSYTHTHTLPPPASSTLFPKSSKHSLPAQSDWLNTSTNSGGKLLASYFSSAGFWQTSMNRDFPLKTHYLWITGEKTGNYCY